MSWTVVGRRPFQAGVSSLQRITVANMVMRVLDRAIQLYGAAGVSDDFPLARF